MGDYMKDDTLLKSSVSGIAASEAVSLSRKWCKFIKSSVSIPENTR